MRITHRMMGDRVIENVTENLRRLSEWQDQLSSGRRIRRPSDDPPGAHLSLLFREGLERTRQYQRNVEDARSWLEATDAALGGVTDLLNRARELTIYGANGSLEQTARDAIAEEIQTLIQHLAELGNAEIGGNFLFAGYAVAAPPFASDGRAVRAISPEESLTREIAPGVQIPVNVTGEFIHNGGTAGIVPTLQDIKTHLEAGDLAALSGPDLAALARHLDTVLQLRASVGGRLRRVELAAERLVASEINLRRLLSENEDIDVEKTVTELAMAEQAYRVALGSAARILQPSLLDFLR